ncbi:hypothetical protein [Natronococcus sp.]|uniref:hypothetical protein n=1 Tax=Natronococcus sp. TaxID=35747 RepID=UPI003A4E5E0C
MPVDTESDCWDKSKRIDCIEVEIERFLQENAAKAYRPAEVMDYLTDEKTGGVSANVARRRGFCQSISDRTGYL